MNTGCSCTLACIDGMGEGAVVTVLQQGCFPPPMLQLPAIFLQQSISACVICGLGRQASAGVEDQIAIRANTRMDRHRITTTCYLFRQVIRNWRLLVGEKPQCTLFSPFLANGGASSAAQNRAAHRRGAVCGHKGANSLASRGSYDECDDWPVKTIILLKMATMRNGLPLA